jgi:O-antigen/teichoic acid export membrane protein
VILAAGLGPALFGAYSLVYGTLLATEVIGRLGLPAALTRQVAAAGTDAPRVAGGGLLLSAITYLMLFVAFWVAAPALAAALNVADGTRLFRIAALDIPFYCLVFVGHAILNGRQRFAAAALVTAIYAAAKAAGILALVWCGLSIAGALVVNAAASAIGLLATALAVRRELGRPAGAAMRVTLRLAVPLSVRGVASQVLAVIGLWALGVGAALVPPDAAGQYAAALSIGRLPIILALGSGSVVVAGVAAALTRGTPDEARQMLADTIRLMLMLLLPAAAVTVVDGSSITTLLFGPAYAVAGPLLAVLFVGQGIGMTLLLVLGAALVGMGAMAALLRATLAALAMTIVLLPLIVPLDALGAALATAAGCFTGVLLAGGAVRRGLGRWLAGSDLARLAAISGAVALLGWSLPGKGLWLIAELAALGAVAVLLLLALGLIRLAELRHLLRRRPTPALSVR